jgi:demethoxyubiquinone hydroxylase (CLK1/Coq7/Cat5 family)
MQTLEEQATFLNTLLRGELSAAETYRQALKKLSDGAGASELHQIHKEHCEAMNALRQHLREHGVEPVQSSGSWGTWAKVVEGAAGLLGRTPALTVLREGEEYGLRSYEDAMEDEDLSADCKALVYDTLLPQTRAHIRTLNQLIDSK